MSHKQIFKIDLNNEVTYLDLTKICFVRLDEDANYLTFEVRFPGDCYLQYLIRQVPNAEINAQVDELRKIYRDLVFAWETFDAQQTVKVNVTPNDMLVGVQTGPSVITGYEGTVSNT